MRAAGGQGHRSCKRKGFNTPKMSVGERSARHARGGRQGTMLLTAPIAHILGMLMLRRYSSTYVHELNINSDRHLPQVALLHRTHVCHAQAHD